MWIDVGDGTEDMILPRLGEVIAIRIGNLDKSAYKYYAGKVVRKDRYLAEGTNPYHTIGLCYDTSDTVKAVFIRLVNCDWMSIES
jgi:hypothetical protein